MSLELNTSTETIVLTTSDVPLIAICSPKEKVPEVCDRKIVLPSTPYTEYPLAPLLLPLINDVAGNCEIVSVALKVIFVYV